MMHGLILSIFFAAITSVALAKRPSVAAFANPKESAGQGAIYSNRGVALPEKLSLAGAFQKSLSFSEPQAGPLPGSPFSDDIQHIVVACNSDPKRLFDFVRNHIEFQPYFASRKGAEQTWLTKSGNEADQAELLVTLLRAAGWAVDYEYGRFFTSNANARA
jgi:hypothetical protein